VRWSQDEGGIQRPRHTAEMEVARNGRKRPAGLPVPAGPTNPGGLRPRLRSAGGRVHSSPSCLVRRLCGGVSHIQSINPLGVAGIDQHSDYLSDSLLAVCGAARQ